MKKMAVAVLLFAAHSTAQADARLSILHGEQGLGVELHCVGDSPAFRSCGASRIAKSDSAEIAVSPAQAAKVFSRLAAKIPLKPLRCPRSALSYSLEWKAAKRAGRACGDERITAALYSAESHIAGFLKK